MKRSILFFLATLLVSGMTFAAALIQQRSVGQNPQQPPARATIEGTVTRADNGQPLKGARVTLQAGGRGQFPALAGIAGGEALSRIANIAGAAATVITDADGRFTFEGVNPGQYRIGADREGFIRSEYGQRTPTGAGAAVPVSANQRLNVDLKMLQASVVSGRVITADGEPAANADVQAYTYQYSNGQRSLAEVRSIQTNDLGEYRLFGLLPGDYFVSVTDDQIEDTVPVGTVDVSQIRGGRGGRGGAAEIQLAPAALGDRGGAIFQALGGVTNPPVFYPGTLDPDNAIPISVGASVEVRGVDFNLRPVRPATISGRVVAPFPLDQGNTSVGFRGRGAIPGQDNVIQVARAVAPVQLSLNRVGGSSTGLAGLLSLRLGSAPVNADGTFEIKGVAPGEYNVIATARDPSDEQYTARTRISVGTSDVANVTVDLRPGVDVRGRIALEGTPPQQFKMSNLRVSLTSEDSPLAGVLNLAALGGRGEIGFDFVGAGGGGRGDVIRTALGGQAVTAEVAEDGSFTLQDVGAMEFRVRVAGLPQGAYVQSGRLESNDALNAPITINEGASLQIALGFTPGRVSGAVLDDRGSPVSGSQVVLVPDEARRGRSDAYFTASADQNGQFVFPTVPPGQYKVFSWEDIPAGAYQYADFIRAYEDRGQSIMVNTSGAVTADVRIIPAK
jgi:protocatechuate 3,4-dioxygenase beta subunit